MATSNKRGAAYFADRNGGGVVQSQELKFALENLNSKMVAGRVTDIILDEGHPKFSKSGGWSSIGSIFFEEINSPKKNKENNTRAYPFFPQFQHPPLVNEIVLLFQLPDKDLGRSDTSKSYYYLNSISLWNSPHHNAYPNVYTYANRDEEKKDYQKIESGGTSKTKNEEEGLDLNGPNSTGGEFIEKSNINSIIPFSGDSILESRFGTSIRLGSTIKSTSLYRNNWSDFGETGDPLLILKNGQTGNNPGFLPTVENINEDPSSIYMTSTQNIPISASSLNYTAISNNQTPDYPGSYVDKPQIILNSGRLVLNSTSDSILLSSQKVINLASLGDLGLASRKAITLEAEEINLGGSNSSQPAVAGETFMTALKSLTKAIEGLAVAIGADPRVLPTTKQMGERLAEKAKAFNENYQNYTSKKVKLS